MVRFSHRNLKLLGTGSALPGPGVDNTELLAQLEALCGPVAARKARAIASRLGIEHRYLSRNLHEPISLPQPDSPDLCCSALSDALLSAEMSSDDLGYMVGHTATPHTLIPGNTAWVAERMNFTAPYMELRQACTGFANALMISSGMLDTGSGLDAMAIVGSEVGSVYFEMSPEFLDNEQLVNYVQMGDGAGAVILGPDDGGTSALIKDIYLGHIGADRKPGFYLDGGGSGNVLCSSKIPVFRHDSEAVRHSGADLFLKGIESIQDRGYALEDFAQIIPHQANGHIGKLLSEYTGLPESRFVVTADQLGNLGSAAIWVSFDRLLKSETLRPGDQVLILGAEATKYLYGGFVYQH